MQSKGESRQSRRIGREQLIMLGDGRTLSPYYAVSKNVSAGGMYFKSLFELQEGACVDICVDDFSTRRNPFQARVVRCEALANPSRFRFGVAVAFLRPEEPGGRYRIPSIPSNDATLDRAWRAAPAARSS